MINEFLEFLNQNFGGFLPFGPTVCHWICTVKYSWGPKCDFDVSIQTFQIQNSLENLISGLVSPFMNFVRIENGIIFLNLYMSSLPKREISFTKICYDLYYPKYNLSTYSKAKGRKNLKTGQTAHNFLGHLISVNLLILVSETSETLVKR